MPSIQKMIGAANKNKFCVVIYVSKEFLTSLCDVLQSAKLRRRHEGFLFVQTMVGFCVEAINALVADCHELDGTQTCVAVPRPERSFSKVFSSLKRLGVESLDERAFESLTSIFDIKVKNKKIHLDDKGRFECEGFQPQDIVCVPLATVHASVDEAGVLGLVHTRFTTSNREVCGCLLDHLKIM